VARVLTPRTRAIMAVHVGGLPCAMDELTALAAAHDLRVIEDAAHALPAYEGGRWVGTLGDAGAFSFYATKNITTGEGGMLVLRDPAAAADARVLALHGISRDAWQRYGAHGRWQYEVLTNGHKYNLTDVAASLGVHQHARRRRLVARYDDGFARVDAVVRPPRRAGVGHAWHLYMLRLRREALSIDREAFVEELAARNIGTSVHFIPLHLHPYYQDAWGYGPGDFPNAEAAYETEISLPLYPGMADADVDDVIDAVTDIVRRRRR
jgi:perosamine synthetase